MGSPSVVTTSYSRDHAARWRRGPEMTARTMTPEELADLLANSSFGDDWFELGRRPLLGVLDTSCLRTGLHYQLRTGSPPASMTTARDGSVRLFMEYDTLVEAQRKLPKFAKSFGMTTAELTRILNEDWLPHIKVVRLPPEMRQADRRAIAVRENDPDDYPAAALAALLSPCILLTHNYTDFGPLGMKSWSQGVDAIVAGIDLRIGQVHMNAVVMVPVVPAMGIGGAAKWASEKIGPWAWIIFGLLVLGGVVIYKRQPQERREKIKKVASQVGVALLDEAMKATAEVHLATAQLRACVVPGPSNRVPESAILRELAMAEESLSAQQLVDLLDESVRPSVARLRAYLRANDKTLVYEARRGGFALGAHYRLRLPHG